MPKLLHLSAKFRLAAAGLAVAAAIAACGGDSTGPNNQIKIASISIDTVSFAVERGTHVTLTATAKDDHGKTVAVPFVWTSDKQTVVTFGPDGQLAALDTGIAIITASSLGVTSAPIEVQVVWVGAANVAAFQWTPPIAATPGAVVTDSIRVQVTNRIGGPAAHAHVKFTASAGGGTVSPSTVTADSLGVATAGWTLGSAIGENTVTAAVVDDRGTAESWVTGNPASFSIYAYDALAVVQGDAQSGQILASLPVSPQVKLVDSLGRPRPGVVVTFAPSNNGRVTTASVATGADGIASPGTWTLGDTPGAESLVATVGLAKLTLQATATGTPVHYVPSAVAAAGFSTCAINTDRTASCWGLQPNVGNGGAQNVSTPTATTGAVQFTSIVGSQTHFCGLGTDSAVYCWGSNSVVDTSGAATTSPVPTKLPSSLTWSHVAPGFGFDCALTTSGVPYCWGDNALGELGDGTSTQRFVPQAVLGGFTFTAIAAGSGHACGLTAAGSAFCWGLNSNGQLGDGTTTTRTTPTAVAGGLTFQAIGAGEAWTCGLTTGGQVYCWGAVAQSNQTQTTPKAYTGAPTFASLTVGGAHACGLTSDGSAYCWGNNAWGQVGDSTTVNRDAPTLVSGGLTYSSISAGYTHTCAIAKPEGAVVCWGRNTSGEIGTSLVSVQLTPRYIVLGVTP